MFNWSCPTHGERGQATIAMVGVLSLAIAAAVALSLFGEAIVHRARARAAADAVALAAAVDVEAADALASWYGERNVQVSRDGNQSIAHSGPSRAAAWASTEPASTQPAPAMVAIVARAEQLLDAEFVSVNWQVTRITVNDAEAFTLRTVAAELGLCEHSLDTASTSGVVFELC